MNFITGQHKNEKRRVEIQTFTAKSTSSKRGNNNEIMPMKTPVKQ
ncbi:29927_t:CDS:1, partial [Gigaspora margarita]